MEVDKVSYDRVRLTMITISSSYLELLKNQGFYGLWRSQVSPGRHCKETILGAGILLTEMTFGPRS